MTFPMVFAFGYWFVHCNNRFLVANMVLVIQNLCVDCGHGFGVVFLLKRGFSFRGHGLWYWLSVHSWFLGWPILFLFADMVLELACVSQGWFLDDNIVFLVAGIVVVLLFAGEWLAVLLPQLQRAL